MKQQFGDYLRRAKQANGQSLVETALILPLLALLLLGVVEFSFLFYAHVQVSNAAREASRAASLYRSTRYSSADTITKCEGAIYGWSLQNVADQAVIAYPLKNNGCRDSSGSLQSTSLGRLDPTPDLPDVIQLTFSNTDDGVFWSGAGQASGDVMPTAGTGATVTLVYPYRLAILSNLIPYLSNPIAIRKSVRFQFAP